MLWTGLEAEASGLCGFRLLSRGVALILEVAMDHCNKI